MKYIANIITKNKIEISDFFNVTSDFSSADTTLPTLIIGWKETKELFPEQDILVYEITPTISWTFSKKEKRYKFEKDLVEFISKVVKNIDSQINYHFFNYILATQEKRNSFINYIHKGGFSLYYNSRFLYVYSPKDKMTLGISLQDLRYAGVDISKFINLLNIFNNNIIVDNISFLSQESLILIKDNTKAVAYLNYLKNFDIYKETENNGKEYYEKV